MTDAKTENKVKWNTGDEVDKEHGERLDRFHSTFFTRLAWPPDARLGRGKDASPIPKEWAKNIKTILFTDTQIQDKVKELATILSKKYAGKKILAVGLLNGAFVFVADLLRYLTIPYEVRAPSCIVLSLPPCAHARS